MNEVARCYLEGYGCKKDKVREPLVKSEQSEHRTCLGNAPRGTQESQASVKARGQHHKLWLAQSASSAAWLTKAKLMPNVSPVPRSWVPLRAERAGEGTQVLPGPMETWHRQWPSSPPPPQTPIRHMRLMFDPLLGRNTVHCSPVLSTG